MYWQTDVQADGHAYGHFRRQIHMQANGNAGREIFSSRELYADRKIPVLYMQTMRNAGKRKVR
jgi:hypothetical protein